MEAENDRRVVELILSESFRSWATGEKDDGSWKVHVEGDPAQYPEVIRQAQLLVRTIRFEVDYMEPGQSLQLRRKIAGSIAGQPPLLVRSRIGFRKWMSYAAAILMMVLGIGIGYWLKPSERVEEVQTLTWKTEVAEPGVIKKMVLPDGTRVTLNAGTTLDYPLPFTDRYVKLNGEAYFDVTHDEQHPFRVRTRQLETTVLGTSFNINTRDDEVKVALVTGTVNVEDKLLHQSLSLQPGKMAIATDGSLAVTSFDHQQVTGWREYVLIYDSEQLGTIFKDLERIYGVRINMKKSVDQTTRYTGRFEAEPLDSILKGIGYVSGFSATRTDNEVFVF